LGIDGTRDQDNWILGYCLKGSGVDNVEVEISCAGERARKRMRKEESKERSGKKSVKISGGVRRRR
jgi:hypothetical protein